MRIATPRYSPGIQSPPGAMIAVGVVAVMGLYGFTTALQKSIALQRTTLLAVRADAGDVRLASAVGRTPTLVYALTEGGASPAPVVARRTPAKPPEPQIGEPAELKLVRLTPAPTSPNLNSSSEVAAPAAAPSAAIAGADAQSADAVSREPATPAAPQ